MTDNPYEAAVVVGTLTRALTDGSRDFRTVPALLIRVIKEDLWRERIDPESGVSYRPTTWAQFVTDDPPMGLGSSQEQLQGLCRGKKAALDALDRVTRRGRGRPPAIGNNVPNYGRPEGNAAAKALRRLNKDRPDLHRRVLAGELSPHGAMIEAGFRPRTITVRADDPERIVATFRRRLDPDTFATLVKLLGAER